MKEGFGGTFMIYTLLVFLAVYITFVAVAFNYARAFKVKDKVMDIIEQNEGIDFGDEGGAVEKINSYLNSVSYNVGKNNIENYCNSDIYKNNNGRVYDKGYCIGIVDSDATGIIYSVKTFVYIEIPFMNLDFTIPVKGETRKIERIS